MQESEIVCDKERSWDVGSKPGGVSHTGAMDMGVNIYGSVEDCWHGDYNEAPVFGEVWTEKHRVFHRDCYIFPGGVTWSASSLSLPSTNRRSLPIKHSLSEPYSRSDPVQSPIDWLIVRLQVS